MKDAIAPDVSRRDSSKPEGPPVQAPIAAGAPTGSRPAPTMPTPDGLVDLFVAQSRRVTNSVHDMARGQTKWGLALATHTGPVRSWNEDYGLAFEVGGTQVLLVADGCGGVPEGQRASYQACFAAARTIFANLSRYPKTSHEYSHFLVRSAIEAAEHQLASVGRALGITSSAGGLRTTLICVVGFADSYAWGYIGDGCIWILRKSGHLDKVMVPQKADARYSNVLAAALGPQTEGDPVIGTSERGGHDLLLVASDGVFDRVPDSFAKDVLRYVLWAEGDLKEATEQILKELATARDAHGFLCDDNMTLGLMMDGRAPKLAPHYWKTPGTVRAEDVAVPAACGA